METNAFSQSDNLGTLIAEHPANPRLQREEPLIGWGFIALGAVFALIGLLVSKGEWPDLLIAAMGLPLVLIGVIVFIRNKRRQDLCIRLFTNGFTRTLSGQTVAVRWDEVAEVWQNVIQTYRGHVRSRTIHTYTLRLADGRKFVFNDQVAQIAGLGTALQQQCAARILPRARASYNTGAVVTFGPFGISREGITKGGATLPWEQVAQVDLRQGMLHIKKKGARRDWAFALATKIPNLPVLMALANQNAPNYGGPEKPN